MVNTNPAATPLSSAYEEPQCPTVSRNGTVITSEAAALTA